MANPISAELTTGTVGELLVQLRLLQYGVQAAPPLKDSGNDLIALRGWEVRCIQVKTTSDRCPAWPDETKLYHLLAVVKLEGEGHELHLDATAIYLLSKPELMELRQSWEALGRFKMTAERIDVLFASGNDARSSGAREDELAALPRQILGSDICKNS